MKISIEIFNHAILEPKLYFCFQLRMINTSTTIKKIASSLLLLALLLSITPKQYFHTVFASHSDVTINLTKDEVQCNAYGFNCDCNQVVCTSPFITESYQVGSQLAPEFNIYRTFFTTDSFLSQTTGQFQLRGPPTFI